MGNGSVKNQCPSGRSVDSIMQMFATLLPHKAGTEDGGYDDEWGR